MTHQQFKIDNPNYPLLVDSLDIEICTISDNDIPKGSGGINGEGYTYGQLRHQPIIPEIMEHIENLQLREFAEECNARNQQNGFQMYRVNGEYCFWGLRVGTVVKLPSLAELKTLLANTEKTEENIRAITYELLRKEIGKQCNMSYKEATLAIGNQLDCVPHEDISGYVFMVPNWAHRWFRHSGYVSSMMSQF